MKGSETGSLDMRTRSKWVQWWILILVISNVGPVTCSCGEPEAIPNSSRNTTGASTYAESTVIRYGCNIGYRIHGLKDYICENGQWIDGGLTCMRLFCQAIDIPDNGRITGTYSRFVGDSVTFACDAGYNLVGSSSMLCRADEEWRPSTPPSCVPKSCGEFGGISNGNLWQSSANGIFNVYGNVIEVTCDDGFTLDGQSRVTCSSNGVWDSRPSCRPPACPQHQGLSSSCLYASDLSDDGLLLSMLCMDNSETVSVTEVGPGTVMCYDDEWDFPDSACYCDCKIHTEVISAYNLVNGFLKHGESLQWTCGAGTIKNTGNSIQCTDGELNTIPECLTDGIADNTDDGSTNNVNVVTNPGGVTEATGVVDDDNGVIVKDNEDGIKPMNPTSKANANSQRSGGFKVQLSLFVYTVTVVLSIFCV